MEAVPLCPLVWKDLKPSPACQKRILVLITFPSCLFPNAQGCISNANCECGSKALSPPKCPLSSWISTFGITGDYFCNPVSWFYTFQTCLSTSSPFPSPISKSIFNSLQWSYSKVLWSDGLKHISSPDSAACKYYNSVLCDLYFQVSNRNYWQADTIILWPVQCR